MFADRDEDSRNGCWSGEVGNRLSPGKSSAERLYLKVQKEQARSVDANQSRRMNMICRRKGLVEAYKEP